MDFNLSEQQKMLQRVAMAFATKLVKPRAAEIDATGEFPFDLAKEMGKRGYQGLPYPAKYGGGEAGYTSYALTLEQICQASLTVGTVMAVNTVLEEAIFRFGSEEQKRTFLAPLAQGELLGSIAFTEAETGSDPRAITTMAMQVHGSYGTMKTMPVERLYRDAKMTEIYVGISEIQRSIIANHLI